LNYYSQISKDEKILKIDWQSYFIFSKYGDSFLDCENMSPKLWQAVASTYQIGYSDCGLFLKKEPNSKVVKDLKLKNFKNGDSYAVKFAINLEQNNSALGKITLYYDIGTKRALAVEAF
jgi:hypothetical protein